MSKRHIAWMEHPLGAADHAGIEANLQRAERWFRWLLLTFPTVDFAADWILWCRALNDLDPVDRERGLAFDDEMITRSDSAWYVGGRISDGMKRGMAAARKAGIRVVDLTSLGEEPPNANGLDNETSFKVGGLLAKAGYKHQHYDEATGKLYLYGSASAAARGLARLAG